MSNSKEGDWTTKDWIKKLKSQGEDSKKYRHKLYKKVEIERIKSGLSFHFTPCFNAIGKKICQSTIYYNF